ncbi:hypothetical protein P4V60_13260, partial [Brevibacillus porteri]|uniref:hypothetical protein n=1 Tax=Brevibacillus porteri TaxID=2126350 RepID=UPI002E21160E|nr:hypothetical protein [Brevibacillus porteri]
RIPDGTYGGVRGRELVTPSYSIGMIPVPTLDPAGIFNMNPVEGGRVRLLQTDYRLPCLLRM